MDWLPEPKPGTQIALGFDGSDVSDWTALAAETQDGFSFTPRYGPQKQPTIWRPEEWGGVIPRDQVDLAVREVFGRFKVARMYADPPRWETDVERWSLDLGEDIVVAWPTYRTRQMHFALERFVTDLAAGRIRHDGCPLTLIAMNNAKKIAKPSDRYILGKPTQTQKIDPAMARVLAHEAAADERASGWPGATDSTVFVFRR